MRILVTGAHGFVGENLIPVLLSAGHDVVGASRFVLEEKSSEISSMDQPQRRRDAEHRRGMFSSFKVDSVGPDTDWSDALKVCDAVVHLAARAHVLKDESADPLAEHRRVNTEGTRRLAEQAAAAGIKRFVFVSSIGVLGNNSLKAKNGHSFSEEDEPDPHDDYSRSKWEAEEALLSVQPEPRSDTSESHRGISRLRTGGTRDRFEYTIIRPPLIYGPGVPGNLRRLVEFAKSGKPFPLGAVRNKRTLIGVRNLTSFIELALTEPRAANQTYVIGDEEQLSTPELYTSICKHLNRAPRLMNVPETILRSLLTVLRKRKMAERLCDTLTVDSSKARNQLGWKQPFTLDQGLAEMVAQ